MIFFTILVLEFFNENLFSNNFLFYVLKLIKQNYKIKLIIKQQQLKMQINNNNSHNNQELLKTKPYLKNPKNKFSDFFSLNIFFKCFIFY
jgi:hypothetical protein